MRCTIFTYIFSFSPSLSFFFLSHFFSLSLHPTSLLIPFFYLTFITLSIYTQKNTHKKTRTHTHTHTPLLLSPPSNRPRPPPPPPPPPLLSQSPPLSPGIIVFPVDESVAAASEGMDAKPMCVTLAGWRGGGKKRREKSA